MKKLGFLFVFSIGIIILFVNNDLYRVTDQIIPTMSQGEQSETILELIKVNDKRYREEAQDAYIDRVWKKTPGRNGLRIAVEKSYEKMKKQGKFDESMLVFEEFSPTIHLEDLPPAPIYRGHPEKEMVALLINVSWGTEHIPTILQTLKQHQVQATFFIEGKWALENKSLIKMIAEQNHVIGSHAYNHPDMTRISSEEIERQIVDTNNIIEAIIGERPKWFAPPSGSFNNRVVTAAHEHKMQTILWTVDTIDWRNPSVSVMINRVMTNIHPGATILMHPTEPIALGLGTLIEEIKERNLKIDTIETLLSESR